MVVSIGTVPRPKGNPAPAMSDPHGEKSPSQPREARRGGGPRALAVSLGKVARQALGSRNLAERSLILDWSSIAGEETARICHPLELSFARRDRRMDGTLTLRVRAGQATRVQHLEPQLIERINGYLGYRAVARLRLLPGPPPGDADATAPRGAGPARATGGVMTDPGGDPALQAALARLGRALEREP